ncbi:hypothetical protein D6764_03110 [Candidatus Woesearchaeota archaeon]|nr:MAG: hypothetical protein D6764_03110 [Candidatus Woesearchaeota archaeon]
MAATLWDLILLFRPLSDEEKVHLSNIRQILDESSEENAQEILRRIKKLLKQRRIGVAYSKLNISKVLADDDSFPEIFLTREDDELKKEVQEYNRIILDSFKKQLFDSLSDRAGILKEFIAPNIVGLDTEKEAVLLQLFAREGVHILLLGDPGTGKTDILMSAAKLHPKSVFGLGSGTSGVGLGASVKGKKKIAGLLPQADGGICCIDELNLMKQSDRAALYNAMEKGFVTYDKGDQHFTMKARVRVLASANPKGDKFAGKFVDTLKKQLPFDSALLTRFHLVFMIRKPDMRGFVEITRKIVRNDSKKLRDEDAEFIKEYVAYAEKVDVQFPKKFEKEVINFVKEIKKDEKRYLIEISPRLVVGFMRMAKASARLHLRDKVEKEDIEHVKDIVRTSLVVS